MGTIREFKAAPGSQLTDEDAAKCGAFLEEKAGAGTQPVPAEEIERLARPKTSPLHKHFEWDDSKAALEHRLNQARLLARSILVVVYRDEADDSPVTTRALHHVTASDGGFKGYISQEVVWQTPEFSEQVRARAGRELRRWRETYRQYESLSSAVAAVDQILGDHDF